MSNKNKPVREDADLHAAVEDFLDRMDDGITPAQLRRFMNRYKDRDGRFRAALADCIRLIAASPQKLVDQANSTLRSRRETKARRR